MDAEEPTATTDLSSSMNEDMEWETSTDETIIREVRFCFFNLSQFKFFISKISIKTFKLL